MEFNNTILIETNIPIKTEDKIEDKTEDKIEDKIEDKTEDKKTYKYFCEICNVGANTKTNWLMHIKTKRHLHGGLLPKTCNICNSSFHNHWLLKQHYIINHATSEERDKCKYYCKICNMVFMSELYFDNHNIGKKHLDNIKCLESLENIKKVIEHKNKPINLEILESYNKL